MNPVHRYGAVQNQTASKERLMVLLFQTALKHMRNAVASFEAGRQDEAAKLCTKASDIVVELESTLDRSKAPELCDNLASVYQFTCFKLIEGATQLAPAPVRDAEKAFAPLVDAFETAVERVRSGT
jgi:flagellar protein FliS